MYHSANSRCDVARTALAIVVADRPLGHGGDPHEAHLRIANGVVVHLTDAFRTRIAEE